MTLRFYTFSYNPHQDHWNHWPSVLFLLSNLESLSLLPLTPPNWLIQTTHVFKFWTVTIHSISFFNIPQCPSRSRSWAIIQKTLPIVSKTTMLSQIAQEFERCFFAKKSDYSYSIFNKEPTTFRFCNIKLFKVNVPLISFEKWLSFCSMATPGRSKYQTNNSQCLLNISEKWSYQMTTKCVIKLSHFLWQIHYDIWQN